MGEFPCKILYLYCMFECVSFVCVCGYVYVCACIFVWTLLLCVCAVCAVCLGFELARVMEEDIYGTQLFIHKNRNTI